MASCKVIENNSSANLLNGLSSHDSLTKRRSTDMQDVMENAQLLEKSDPEKAIQAYTSIVNAEVEREADKAVKDEAIKVKEQCILELGKLLVKTKQAERLGELIRCVRPLLGDFSKAKAAKIYRALIEMLLDMDTHTGQEVELCQDCIQWAKDQQRTFLRQALEARLISFYFEESRYEEALALGSELIRELKKLDDKNLLVEVQLSESKVYHKLSNLPKSRAALTSARTTANSIYCPPKLQASLDLQAGILHAADDKDFKTAFSYFYEGFEGYDSIQDQDLAVLSLKYMLLMKIMLGLAEDVHNIVSGKLALKYAGKEIQAMKTIANASQKRSLADFQEALTTYKKELCDDAIVDHHLKTLYDKLLEQNLCKIIEPYSRVQVAHIAKTIELPLEIVEKKLSQMILDVSFYGILDQGDGVLIVFDEIKKDQTYLTANELLANVGKVVDSLYEKAKKLS